MTLHDHAATTIAKAGATQCSEDAQFSKLSCWRSPVFVVYLHVWPVAPQLQGGLLAVPVPKDILQNGDTLSFCLCGAFSVNQQFTIIGVQATDASKNTVPSCSAFASQSWSFGMSPVFAGATDACCVLCLTLWTADNACRVLAAQQRHWRRMQIVMKYSSFVHPRLFVYSFNSLAAGNVSRWRRKPVTCLTRGSLPHAILTGNCVLELNLGRLEAGRAECRHLEADC